MSIRESSIHPEAGRCSRGVGISDHVQVEVLDVIHVCESVWGVNGLLGAAEIDDRADAVLDQAVLRRFGEVVEAVGTEEGTPARGLAVRSPVAAEIADVVGAGNGLANESRS